MVLNLWKNPRGKAWIPYFHGLSLLQHQARQTQPSAAQCFVSCARWPRVSCANFGMVVYLKMI